MSISTVSVPVPLSGEGALVDVSALVGAKTVVLTGQFKGIYELLASQDDSHFVPALLFDAGGVEAIRQTIAGAFKSVRAKAATPGTAPLGVITCEVSGVASVGQNYFATLANLSAGFTGSTPVVDTVLLFPPSGPEEDICLICRGNFQGLLVVEGSLDGSRFCPIGSWRVDRVLEGAAKVLEFSPLTTTVKTRYLKISLNGPVGAEGVVVTMVNIADCEEYDPVNRSFMAVGAQLIAREHPSGIDVLKDGRPFFCGGADSRNWQETAIAQAYDYHTRQWVALASLGCGRSDNMSVVIDDGRVLTAGGWESTDEWTSCEIYTP
jgi:hypothetical protein